MARERRRAGRRKPVPTARILPAAKQAYSEFWLFYWTSFYLLDKPFFYFWLTIGCKMLLAMYLAVLPSPLAEHGDRDDSAVEARLLRAVRRELPQCHRPHHLLRRS